MKRRRAQDNASTAGGSEAAPSEPGRLRRLWASWIKPLMIVLVVMGSFRSAIADWNDVPSGSMQPTILIGDRIVVNKLAYDVRLPFTDISLSRHSDPQRGDVIVFFSPDEDRRMVKRVIGLPGDVIELHDGVLHLNGSPVALEPLTSGSPTYRLGVEDLAGARHLVMALPGRPANRNYGPITIPEGHYFVMGDNRDNSRDSRIFGVVSRDAIVGQATHVAFSLDPSNGYWPRGRWFEELD